MTVVWAWANLGDNTLKKHNIKQYWLLLSVLSVKVFNPEWKRVFVVDKDTYDFLVERKWDILWDEIKVIDFKHTEFGNLYDIKLYSWPKLYSYGLIDDDMLILDVDCVFVKPFVIPDKEKISGVTYNHKDTIWYWGDNINLSYKWPYIKEVANVLNINMRQDSICFQGAPIYVPKGFGKQIQTTLIKNIKKCESVFGGMTPNDTFYAIEEEFPLAEIAVRETGVGYLDTTCFKHGFIYKANRNIIRGFITPERILGINVFEKYLSEYV